MCIIYSKYYMYILYILYLYSLLQNSIVWSPLDTCDCSRIVSSPSDFWRGEVGPADTARSDAIVWFGKIASR